MTAPRRIGLMGPFGYGNLGDNGLVGAMISNIRDRHPDWEILGYTLNPVETERRLGITSHPLGRMTWVDDADTKLGPYGKLMRRLRESDRSAVRKFERVAGRVPSEFGMLVRSFGSLKDVDVLIVCGSGQIQDYWAGGSPWSYPYTVLRWAILARLRGTKFMVVSAGAGPVDSGLSRRFYRWALSLASYRSYRDQWSRDFVENEIGHKGGDPVVPDLAFSMSLAALDAPSSPVATVADAVNTVDPERRVIGIGPIGYFRDGSWPEADDTVWNAYLEAIVGFAMSVFDAGDTVVFLKGEAVYDQPAVDDVLVALRERGAPVDEQVLDLPITTLDELLLALARCDAIVASRLHNVLIGFMLGRPVIGMSYQSKFDSLMSDFGQADFCIPCGDVTSQKLVDLLATLTAQPDVGEHVASVAAGKRKELDEQYEHIFAQL